MEHSKTQVLINIILHQFTNYVLIGAIFLCVISYIYFANSAVRSVTLLENSKPELEMLSARVSDLESRSLALEQKISIERAKTLGLSEVNNPLFLVKGDEREALSLNIR